MHGAVTPTSEPSIVAVIGAFSRLRWRLLRSSLRMPGAQRAAAILGLLVSVVFGSLVGLGLFIGLQVSTDQRRESMLIIAPVLVLLAILALGIIAGVTQPIDPRVLATEPISDGRLSLGLLTGSAVGPPGLSAALVGVGLYGGALDDVAGIVPSLVAVAVFLASLLLVSRSTINLLGVFVTRFPRAGQIVIGLSSLVFYAGVQFVPRVIADLEPAERDRLAGILRWSPPGQLGEALGVANDQPFVSLGRTAIAAVWLVPLAFVYAGTTRRLLLSTRRVDSRPTDDATARKRVSSLLRRACGSGAVGAVAWRGVVTRFRTPRTALETVIGASVGLAIVLVPTLTRNEVGAGAVLVGGAVQLAVLFIAGNSFGNDGPALGSELLCGVEPDLLVRAKARSIVVVTAPLAVIGPLIATAITGEWRFLPAGILVGVGGLLAGAGGAIVQSTLVPIAIPESDNPLASGDSGKGLLAALILALVLTCLAIVTLPIALGLLWAVDRGEQLLVLLLAGATLGAGWLVLQLGIRYASREWRRREPEFYDAVVPAR